MLWEFPVSATSRSSTRSPPSPPTARTSARRCPPSCVRAPREHLVPTVAFGGRARRADARARRPPARSPRSWSRTRTADRRRRLWGTVAMRDPASCSSAPPTTRGCDRRRRRRTDADVGARGGGRPVPAGTTRGPRSTTRTRGPPALPPGLAHHPRPVVPRRRRRASNGRGRKPYPAQSRAEPPFRGFANFRPDVLCLGRFPTDTATTCELSVHGCMQVRQRKERTCIGNIGGGRSPSRSSRSWG